jgi:hypothetical protein
MNQGVQILLNRMDSHPEEFVPDLQSHYPHKWRALLLKVDSRVQNANTKHLNKNIDLYTPELAFLSDEEIFALHAKVQSIRGDLFTKEVMATLLADEDRNLAELSSFSGNSLSASKTITLSNTGAVSGTVLGKLRYP